MVDNILTTSDCSKVTRIPVTTLRWYRHQGTGPKSFRLGPRKVFYKESDVMAWLDQQYNADQDTT